MGLHEQFSHVRGQILLTHPLPPINHVFSLMIQDEKQRGVGLENGSFDPQLAYAVQSAQNSKQKYYKKDKDRPLCVHYGILGNTKEKCFKRHGYPPGYKKGKSAQYPQAVNQVCDEQVNTETVMNHQQYQQLIAYLQSQMARSNFPDSDQMNNMPIGMTFSFVESHSLNHANTWILDSGATSHICHSLQCFDHFINLSNRYVLLPKNAKVAVTAIGIVKLGPKLVLHNVLFIPSFKLNTVSSLLQDTNCSVSFSHDGFLIQEHQG